MPSSGQQTAITTLETSMGYILLLVGATLLSYLSLKQQRDALACGGEVPNTFGLQLVADVVVGAALLYFYGLSLQQTDEAAAARPLAGFPALPCWRPPACAYLILSPRHKPPGVAIYFRENKLGGRQWHFRMRSFWQGLFFARQAVKAIRA